MMKHMTIIRKFLMSLGCEVSALENKHLGIIKKIPQQKKIKVPQEILQKADNSIARALLGLQIHFGLTLSEAMRMMPSIHIQEQQLWLTREITFNNEDRFVPFQNPEQTKILKKLNELGCVDNSPTAYVPRLVRGIQ